MLQRLLHIRLDVKISSRHSNLLFGTPIQSQPCNQCGFRLFSSHKAIALRNYYEKSSFIRNGIFCIRPRYFSSQVDAEKKNDVVDCTKTKVTLETSKKINTKLKTPELKRLFTLAEPEKWTLAGEAQLVLYYFYITS